MGLIFSKNSESPYYTKLIEHGIGDELAKCLDKNIKSGKIKYTDLDMRVKETLSKTVEIESTIHALEQLKLNDSEHISKQILKAIEPYNTDNMCMMHINEKPLGDIYGPKWNSMDEILIRPHRTLHVTRNERRFVLESTPNYRELPAAPNCKVLCSNLPNDVYEDDIILLMETCGFLREVRLNIDPNTQVNNGCAVVSFENEAQAKNAIRKLHNFEIRPRKKMKVSKAVRSIETIIIRNIKTNANPTIADVLDNIDIIDVVSIGIFKNYIHPLQKYNREFFALVAREVYRQKNDNVHVRVAGELDSNGEVDDEHICLKSNLSRQCLCVCKLLDDIQRKKKQIHDIEQKCSTKQIQRAREKCFLHSVHHSLAIEEYDKTAINDDSFTNLVTASKNSLKLIEKDQITVEDIKKLHSDLHMCTDNQNGEFRTEKSMTFFYGKWKEYLEPSRIEESLTKNLTLLNTSLASEVDQKKKFPIYAAVLTTQFLEIHPFTDGNGRLSRLIFNMMLAKQNYPCITFLVTESTEYFEALHFAHKTSDQCLLFVFIAKSIIKSLEKYEIHLKND